MKTLLLATATLTASVGLGHAATLDFVGFGAGNYGSSITVSGATITNASGGNILVGASAAGKADGFCSLSSFGTCEADTDLTFGSAVTNLSFDLDGSNPGDMVDISLYGLGNALLATLSYTTPDQHIDLSAYGTITRLFFDDSSTAAGYGYSNFLFDSVGGQVPLPAGLPLMLGGVAALFGLGRKKRRA